MVFRQRFPFLRPAQRCRIGQSVSGYAICGMRIFISGPFAVVIVEHMPGNDRSSVDHPRFIIYADNHGHIKELISVRPFEFFSMRNRMSGIPMTVKCFMRLSAERSAGRKGSRWKLMCRWHILTASSERRTCAC